MKNVYVPKSKGTHKNKSVSKDKEKTKRNNLTNNTNNVMKAKSNEGTKEPKTQPQHRITFEGGDSLIIDEPFVNSYIYGPSQWQPLRDVHGFEEEDIQYR